MKVLGAWGHRLWCEPQRTSRFRAGVVQQEARQGGPGHGVRCHLCGTRALLIYLLFSFSWPILFGAFRSCSWVLP